MAGYGTFICTMAGYGAFMAVTWEQYRQFLYMKTQDKIDCGDLLLVK